MLGSATRPTRLATGHCPVASRVVGTGHCPVASPGRRLEPLVFPYELLELSAELKLVGGRLQTATQADAVDATCDLVAGGSGADAGFTRVTTRGAAFSR